MGTPGAPISNLDNPTVQGAPMAPAVAGQPAPQPAPQPITVPPTQSAPAVTPVAAPDAAPAQSISPDFPIEHNGTQVTMADVLASHDAALELHLADPAMKEFLTTVSLAYRGDQAAMTKLQAINNQIAPAQAAPVPVAPPMADAAAAPASAVPASGGLPKTQPQPAAGGMDVNRFTKGVTQAITDVVKPLTDKMDRMSTFLDERDAASELDSMKSFLESKKANYPNLASNATAAQRIHSYWNVAVATAARNGTAKPDQQDLEKMIKTEEAYLAANVPVAQDGTPQAEITRMDQPEPRIPGRTVPGRAPEGPFDASMSFNRQAAVSNSALPVAGTAPGVEPAPAKPMSQNQMGNDMQQQFREMGGGK